MHVPLAFQLLLLPELLGQAAFHLAETHVMQFGGINMGTGNHRCIHQTCQFGSALHGGIGMIRRIQRDQNTLIQTGVQR